MQSDQQEKTTANWIKEAQKGYIRVAVLILVNKQPAHGYEIMKEIKDRTKGFWKPTAGGVYPVLRSLEQAGYVKGEWSTKRNRKVKTYCITESGRQILTSTLTRQNEIAANMSLLFREFSRDVLNMGTTEFPVHAIASPFSAFLEDKPKDKSETTATRRMLEEKRENLRRMIKTMQDDLSEVENHLAETEPTR